MGVRPSFEGRFEVVEKSAAEVARGVAVCHAGTRNPGSVTGADEEAAMAQPIAFPRLGANMAAIDSTLLFARVKGWMSVVSQVEMLAEA